MSRNLERRRGSFWLLVLRRATQVKLVQINGYGGKTILLPSGVRLEYAEQGRPTGLPLILLHGYSDSWHSFDPMLHYLPAMKGWPVMWPGLQPG